MWERVSECGRERVSECGRESESVGERVRVWERE